MGVNVTSSTNKPIKSIMPKSDYTVPYAGLMLIISIHIQPYTRLSTSTTQCVALHAELNDDY